MLNVGDQRGGWRSTGVVALWGDFVADCFNMLLYFLFFGIVMIYIGRPLHLIRQMYYTYVRFVRRVHAIAKWRRATRNLNERFPDVTGVELRALDADDVCIICREAKVKF